MRDDPIDVSNRRERPTNKRPVDWMAARDAGEIRPRHAHHFLPILLKHSIFFHCLRPGIYFQILSLIFKKNVINSKSIFILLQITSSDFQRNYQIY